MNLRTPTVMRLFECQNSMTNAATKIGMKRITHHDLRHLFATICIESGVDIPTVSRWLGHKDGGALCMKTYGHLRQDHSLAQAQRVSFGMATYRISSSEVATIPRAERAAFPEVRDRRVTSRVG